MVAINPWYRCECGKIHILSLNIGAPSVCTCGRKLFLSLLIKEVRKDG